MLPGGNAGQEQLREEPKGSQLASLAQESLQLVARLQGEEEEESALRPLLFCPGRPYVQGVAGGDAGLEQLREEPEGSQLASLAP